MLQPSRLRVFAFLALFVTFIVSVARAQTAVDGAVGGTVTDASGAIVNGAKITVHENATNAEQAATADSAGYFRVIHLQPGTYSVTITAAGFEPYKSVDVLVQVGLLTTVDPHMQVGSTSQTVEVSGASPLVNTTNPDFAGIIDQKVLHDLPVSNYRWSSYALLTPAVVNDSNGYGLLSFRGQSTLLNNVTVDGTDDNQAFFSEERGRTRAGYSSAKEAVQEFQVNTSNYSVEYGRSAGGIVTCLIVVVTVFRSPVTMLLPVTSRAVTDRLSPLPLMSFPPLHSNAQILRSQVQGALDPARGRLLRIVSGSSVQGHPSFPPRSRAPL